MKDLTPQQIEWLKARVPSFASAYEKARAKEMDEAANKAQFANELAVRAKQVAHANH